MDHFAKPEDELSIAQKNRTLHRNFQGYSTKAGSDLYGFGMSSISHFGTTYAQNAKTLREYYDAIDVGNFATHAGYRMSIDDRVRKYVIMRLMCDLVLDTGELRDKFAVEFESYFSNSLEKLDPLIHDGLITRGDDGLRVTAAGRMFLRNIAMCFDAYNGELRKERPLYSRTV